MLVALAVGVRAGAPRGEAPWPRQACASRPARRLDKASRGGSPLLPTASLDRSRREKRGWVQTAENFSRPRCVQGSGEALQRRFCDARGLRFFCRPIRGDYRWGGFLVELPTARRLSRRQNPAQPSDHASVGWANDRWGLLSWRPFSVGWRRPRRLPPMPRPVDRRVVFPPRPQAFLRRLPRLLFRQPELPSLRSRLPRRLSAFRQRLPRRLARFPQGARAILRRDPSSAGR
jgi:hypothetical protein